MAESPSLAEPSPKESHDLGSQNPNPNSHTEDPSPNPQPSAPETQNPPPQNPVNEKNQSEEEPQVVVEAHEHQDDPDPEAEQQEPEGMKLTLSPRGSSMSSDTLNKGNPTASSARRAPKRKKGSKNHISQVALERKLQQMSVGFKPIPFMPGKALDFSRHEELLKKLGLWEFAHVEFDRNIRADLIVKLIANYNPKTRGSYVNDCRVGVNRADLGRALKLPKKLDCDVESFPAEFLSFLEEFVSNWMLLHEDLWITPNEVVNWTKLIKEGHPQKVDWAGLIWFMVEKELAQGSSLKNCYYASHLQQLIKVQKEELLRDTLTVEVENLKEEVENSKEALSVEDDEDGGEVKMLSFEELSMEGQKSEEQNVDLRLGQDCLTHVENVGDAGKVEKTGESDANEEKTKGVNKAGNGDDISKFRSVDEFDNADNVQCAEHVENVENAENSKEETKDVDMMDFGDCEVEEQGQGQWLLDDKTDGGQHFLQRCSMADVKVSVVDRKPDGISEDVENEEVEEDGHVKGFKILQKGPLDGLTSVNLMQAFETGQLPYTSPELGGPSSLELMSSRVENNVMFGGPSLFNHIGKREIDHEHDIPNHAVNDNHKRMRINGPWDHKPPAFDICLEQIEQGLEKLKTAHVASIEEVYQQASMNQQFCAHQIAEKDDEILQLRCKLEELQRRRQAEVNRLDRELYLMSSVIDGYRRALKETQRAFAEYRKRCQVPDEPIYKDAGSGGVVKSIMELERERTKQEEEKKMMCNLLEETYKKHIDDYEVKWAEVFAKVHSLDSRLMNAGKEVDLLKDHLVERKTSANVQIEQEGPSE